MSTALVAFVVPNAAALETNTPPTAQHSDRAVEDSDGDGEVTIRLEDKQSEDPDHIHREGDDLLCTIDGSTTDGDNGIVGWDWWNTTDVNDTEFEPWGAHLDRWLDNSDPTKKLTFGVGTWRIALRVEDACGAHDWTNFTLEVRPQLIELFTFDSGSLGSNWTTSGLWHVEDRCDVEADGDYLAYNEYDKDDALSSEDCDYETGSINSGEAKVVTIDPSKSASSSEKSWYRFGVEFDHFFRVGTSPLDDEDRMIFEVSFDSGETWVGSNHTAFGCGTDDNDEGKNCWDDDSNDTDEWLTQTNIFDVREENYDGGTVQLRWMFNTTDTHDNNNLGWLVDNLEIFGTVENDPPTGGSLDSHCSVRLDDLQTEGHEFECDAYVPDANDTDGSIIENRFIWDDGTTSTTDDPSTGVVEHQYPVQSGTYEPFLRVTDDGMATGTSNTELVRFIYWDQEGADWDPFGVFHRETDGDGGDCGVDALSGDEWIAMNDASDCEYSSFDDGDTVELDSQLDTSPFEGTEDGDPGGWKIEFQSQADLTCGDSVQLQIRLDGNTDWNTTDVESNCNQNEPLDDEWAGYHDLAGGDTDDFKTLDDDGNWVDTSSFPSDLELRWRLDASEGGSQGWFMDDVAFVGFTE